MGKYDANPVKKDTPPSPAHTPRPKASRKQRISIICGCIATAVILIAVIVALLLNTGTTDNGKILPNVYAAGVNLGGMSKDDARSALQLAVNNALSRNPMVVNFPDGTLKLAPEDTKFSVDVDAVVEAAYDYGRTGPKEKQKALRNRAKDSVFTIALLPYMQDLDLEYIYNAVEAFCSTHGSQVPSSVSVSGERPTYDPNRPNTDVVHQIMTITVGAPDYDLTADELYAQILDAYSLNVKNFTYQADTGTTPEPPDAEMIFYEYCTLPQNASQNPENYDIIPEVYGYGFDISEVQRLIEKTGYGESIDVEMRFLYPNITVADLEDVTFDDKLGTVTVTGEDSVSRNNNLKLSCQALNGLIIAPGETFSFNDVLGRPTAQKGYKQYEDYLNGVLTNIVGGGIEQTAAALYYCALMADLDILERSNNGFAVDYIDKGLDVRIEWGKYDLKFINTTEAPIRIDASAEENSVTVRLMGTDDRNYTVNITTEVLEERKPEIAYQYMDQNNIYGYTDGKVLEEGITGYLVKTTVERVHKQTELVISTEQIDTSTYDKRDKKVVAINPPSEDE